MSRISVEKMYKNYDLLSDAKKEDKIKELQYVKLYEEIISAAKGGNKEKRLASQFIVRYFKDFPDLHYQAIEALFDICEDDDISIRKQAMKDLPKLCKDTKEHTAKIADILTQLLQLEDQQEHIIATNSLCEVIRSDPLQALKGFFKQFSAGEDMVREKCVKFVISKFPSLKDVITKDIEDHIISEVKKVIEECTPGEYITLMEYLGSTGLVCNLAGQQEFVNIAIEQAELDHVIDFLDKDNSNINRLISCISFSLPYFSTKIPSTKFFIYICDIILPQWEAIGSMDHAEQVRLALLRQFAETSVHCGTLDNPSDQVQHIFDILKVYMPLPPENSELQAVPMHEFSYVECLLYAFHQLARQCPEFLTQNPVVLKDFRSRLQYFSRGVQGCIKSLKETVDIKEEDRKIKATAYKVTTNINTLIRDLFYTPPTYKSIVTLSWKLEDNSKKLEESPTTPGSKRHAQITIDFDKDRGIKHKRTTDNVKIYKPPSGKFSNNFHSQMRKTGRSGGRGRGGRGTGRGRSGIRGSWRK